MNTGALDATKVTLMGVVVRKAVAAQAAQELLDKVITVPLEQVAGLERLQLRVALVGLVFSLP